MGNENKAVIDDKYLEGVWYNGDVGEFEEYERTDDGEVDIIVDGEIVDTVEYFETGGLTRVEDDAVENPVEYYEEIVDYMFTRQHPTLPFNQEISFMYTRENIDICEK